MATTERVTVTLPAQLVERIDKYARSRSHFIREAVEHEFVRRREGLLRSLKGPHPESVELVDRGLAGWAASLPPDYHRLVEPTGGRPVRWIDGEGWIDDLK